jgi:RHS repeat-associated protein
MEQTQTHSVTSTQVITYQYDNANRMTKAGGVTYTGDNNGNLINDGSALYRYDPANRLISTTLSGTTSLFNYNGDGARLKQTVAGTVTTYTQDLAAPLPVVLQSKTGTNTTKYLYSLGTRPLAQNATAWEYFLPDALGSVRQIVDTNGNVTLAKSYEPYGSVLNSSGTASSIFSYAGEQSDTYIKLLFLRARYYSPETARFLSKDVWQGDYARPQSLNAWSYTEADPINRTDPSGQFSAVAIANTVLGGPTLYGLDRIEWAFASMGDHYGWISLLLDADESNNYVHNWSNLTQRETYGHIRCSEDGQSLSREQPFEWLKTTVEPPLAALPRPRPDWARWWRDGGVYSLITQGQEKFYFDNGDNGQMTDLPDFQVTFGAQAGPGGLAVIQDRYGNVYGGASLGPSKGGGVYLGEGYIGRGNFWTGFSGFVADEDQLKTKISGFAAELGGSLLIGLYVNWNDVALFTSGLQAGIGVAGNVTLGPTSHSNKAWDWMFHHSSPSREEVWQRMLKSVADNPCGGCSAAK